MEGVNSKYTSMQKSYEEYAVLARQKRRYLNSVNILATILDNQKTAYSQRVIDGITISLTKCLDTILQDKEYIVELEFYRPRDVNSLRAWLIDEHGDRVPPNIVEGDMLNQVLSFSASVILTKLNGHNWFFYDEAFASANSRSLILIRRLLRMFIDEGVNFVFVSQNPLLFTEFDRNLIELIQEAGVVSTVVQTQMTASNDSNLDEKVLELHDSVLRGYS